MAQLRQKLNRKNGLLVKLRHQVSSNLLKTIYFALFNSHLCYAAQVWGQESNSVVDKMKRTQNKALRILVLRTEQNLQILSMPTKKFWHYKTSLHWTIAYLSMINFVITYQMLSQIISNFLKISTGTTQGVLIISP